MIAGRLTFSGYRRKWPTAPSYRFPKLRLKLRNGWSGWSHSSPYLLVRSISNVAYCASFETIELFPPLVRSSGLLTLVIVYHWRNYQVWFLMSLIIVVYLSHHKFSSF